MIKKHISVPFSIRFYATNEIFQNYSDFVHSWMMGYQWIKILNPVRLNARYSFLPNDPTDISIVILREIETNREPNMNGFKKQFNMY